MFDYTREQIALMDEYGVEILHRTVAGAVRLKKNTYGELEPDVDHLGQFRCGSPKAIAELRDKTTGLIYISAEGSDNADAAAQAIAKLPTTPKPRTKQQMRVEENMDAQNDALAAKDRTIAELQARLAAVEAPPEPVGVGGGDDAPDGDTPPAASRKPRGRAS